MRFIVPSMVITLALAAATALAQQSQPASQTPAADSLRKEWIDPDTGHRIFRLSTENGANSLYFHYNAYSPDGTKVIFNSPSGITAADLNTHATQVIVPSARGAAPQPAGTEPANPARGRGARGPTGPRLLEVARKTNEVLYINNGQIMAADITTQQTRPIVALPQGLQVSCANCDASLFAGVIMDAPPPEGATVLKPDKIPAVDQFARMFPGKTQADLTPEQILSAQKETRLASQLTAAVTAANPRCLFTLNAKTGEVKRFGYAYAWLNHLQFSPTDPNMLMFCHEGTWHEVDRVWTINVADEKPTPRLMHQRTMNLEIAGHEWWAPDGQSVWFDNQTPRSEQFWIAGVPLAPAGAKETRYQLQRDWWGIHFSMTKDAKMFASDGADPGQVSFSKDAMWINLFRVQPDGTLSREKMVNMKNHDYVTSASVPGHTGVEPNVTFSPDAKHLIFTGTFDGARHVYEVEVEKAK